MKKIVVALFIMYLANVYGDNETLSKFALGLGYTPYKYVKLVESRIQSKPKICVIFDDVAYKCKKYKITDSDDLVVNLDNSILVKSIVGARVIENLNIDLCNPTITFPVYYMIFWHVGRNSDNFKDTVIYPTYVLDNEDRVRLSFLNKYGVTQYCMNSNYNLSDEDIIKHRNDMVFAINRIDNIKYDESDVVREKKLRQNNGYYQPLRIDDNVFPYKMVLLSKSQAQDLAVKEYNAYLKSPLLIYENTQNKIIKSNNIAKSKLVVKQNNNFRNKLTEGDSTNCGTVIKVKSKLVYIQTGSDAGSVWITKTNIYPQSDSDGRVIDCKDNNRWYKRYGNWTQGNGLQYIDNGVNYVDY